MSASVTVADAIVARLVDAGVRALFGVPGGGGNLDLIDAAGRAGLPFVLTATETAGAIAAMAQAEITGRPGACLTTLGPGAASVVNGVACACLDRAPLLVFTDAEAAGGRSEHQRLDQRALFSRVTNLSASLTPQAALELVDRAIAAACGPRPGPVHLDCPSDVLSSAHGLRESSAAETIPDRPAPSENALPESMVAAARRPLLLCGLGARRAEDARALRMLCDRRGIPAMVTYKAKGVVPDDHSWFAGVFTNAAIERSIVDQSDLLIGIGLDPVELLPRAWPYRQPILYWGPWAVPTDHVPFLAQSIGSGAFAAAFLGEHLPSAAWDGERLRLEVLGQRDALDVPAAGLTPARVVQMAAAHLASEARVTVDAGAHMFPATLLWPVAEPNDMLISNGLSTMGFALPAAIGAARLDRSRPVVALTGDGGLLMCAGELLTAAREGLRIIVIVFNDSSLSLIELKQQARRLPPAGVALGSVDWATIAAGFGVTPFTASNETEFQWALDRAVECEGPSLIDARIDRTPYTATMKAVRG